ncbi:MAG: tRNA pseudouridine(38-40) synthase TruA [Anaerolineales bacterium]
MTKIRQSSMEHYQIILAYDGSHFKGFQRQAKARSVQGVVEDSLRKLNWQGKSILAAGRTDTGVHATGQVITFELEWKHGSQELLTALNSLLPSDVAVREVRLVCPSFHPRYDASWRRYIYHIYCQPVREPLLEPYAWRVWPAVDIKPLKEAASPLIGTFDFSTFGSPPQTGGNTVRCVLQADWKQEAPYLAFEITAQAFLYHMVRRVVFMQVMIAQGKLTVYELQQALKTGSDIKIGGDQWKGLSNRLAHGLAPPQGLVLAEVHYPPETLHLDEDKG